MKNKVKSGNLKAKNIYEIIRNVTTNYVNLQL